MSALERICDHVLETRAGDIPAAAIEAAKTAFLDTLGVGLAGAAAPVADRLLAAAGHWGQGGAAGVLGRSARLPALSAAAVNGVQIHALEWDAVHEPAVVHAMSVVSAALIAEAQTRPPVSGRDALAALVVGVDLAVTLGLATKGGLRFFRPATAGLFAAAAALARLRRFNRASLQHLFGLAYTQIPGTMQAHVEGSAALALQVGLAARHAVAAADMAEAGLEGPRDVFDGPFGYFTLIEDGGDLEAAAQRLGTHWRIAELSHKPFPTGRAAQGALDMVLRHAKARRLAPEDVAGITATVPPLIARLVARPHKREMSTSYARLCLPYLLAVAVADHDIDIASYDAPRLADPALKRLAETVRIEEDGSADPNAMTPQRIVLTLASGERIEETVEAVPGSPGNPLSDAQRLAKFRRCARHGGMSEDAADRLIAQLQDLDAAADTAVALAPAFRPAFRPAFCPAFCPASTGA